MRKIFFALLLPSLGLAGIIALTDTQKASALSGSEFQASRIIDNAFFFNNNTMDAGTIQAFLNSKVPECDTNGTEPYAGTTRAAYGTSRGYPPPYTCLKDYRQDTPAKSAESGLCGNYGGGNNSAAEIIYHVANTCGINPRTLIVLLQKEQSLITDDWPWSIQYRSATGYGCPDTAACDSQYYGFFNQVWSAARQFKRYARDAHIFNHRANNTSYVQYNPNGGCGGTNVHIQNQATANLYNYTPYQPNSAALNNLYGTGDSCSAYGNRNFWRMWRDWFGPVTGTGYEWQYVSSTISGNSWIVNGNSQYTITLTAKNTGTQTWTNNEYPVQLATFRPTNHHSPLHHSSWHSPNRLTTLNEEEVLPGENGTFTFTITTPNVSGPYREHFNLVAEGAAWMQDIGFSFEFTVTKATYKWQLESYESNHGFTLRPGQIAQFTLYAKNTGNTFWNNTTNPVRLATWHPSYRISRLCSDHTNWVVGCIRAANLVEPSVAPGGVGTFTFTAQAPQQPGFYVERFNLVMEGISWFEDPWVEFNVTVGNFYTWQLESYESSNSFTLSTGESSEIIFYARNTGNVTWNNTTNPVRLATWHPSYRTSIFNPNDGSWINQYRMATLDSTTPTVEPGEVGKFVFDVRAPNNPGFYVERVNLVMEGIAWFRDPWVEFNFTVVN